MVYPQKNQTGSVGEKYDRVMNLIARWGDALSSPTQVYLANNEQLTAINAPSFSRHPPSLTTKHLLRDGQTSR